jgi:glutaredoxin-like protein
MSLLSPDNRTEIKQLFEAFVGDVRLIHFTQRESPLFIPGQDCETCKDTRALLEEVVSLSEKLKLEVHELSPDNELARQYGIDRVPALIMEGDGIKGKVRYFGMPSGYEFSVLLGSLMDASKGAGDLAESSMEALQQLDKDVHIQVFVTPTCSYCPPVARLAHKIAIENEHVVADVIEVNEFPYFAQRYAIRGVPKTVINETVEFIGNVSEAQFIEHVQRATSPPETKL